MYRPFSSWPSVQDSPVCVRPSHGVSPQRTRPRWMMPMPAMVMLLELARHRDKSRKHHYFTAIAIGLVPRSLALAQRVGVNSGAQDGWVGRDPGEVLAGVRLSGRDYFAVPHASVPIIVMVCARVTNQVCTLGGRGRPIEVRHLPRLPVALAALSALRRRVPVCTQGYRCRLEKNATQMAAISCGSR